AEGEGVDGHAGRELQPQEVIPRLALEVYEVVEAVGIDRDGAVLYVRARVGCTHRYAIDQHLDAAVAVRGLVHDQVDVLRLQVVLECGLWPRLRVLAGDYATASDT